MAATVVAAMFNRIGRFRSEFSTYNVPSPCWHSYIDNNIRHRHDIFPVCGLPSSGVLSDENSNNTSVRSPSEIQLQQVQNKSSMCYRRLFRRQDNEEDLRAFIGMVQTMSRLPEYSAHTTLVLPRTSSDASKRTQVPLVGWEPKQPILGLWGDAYEESQREECLTLVPQLTTLWNALLTFPEKQANQGS